MPFCKPLYSKDLGKSKIGKMRPSPPKRAIRIDVNPYVSTKMPDIVQRLLIRQALD